MVLLHPVLPMVCRELYLQPEFISITGLHGGTRQNHLQIIWHAANTCFDADILSQMYFIMKEDLVPWFRMLQRIIDPDRGFGYDYDVCNTEIIMSRLSVRDGRIYLPDGMNYQVLVLPESGIVPVEVAHKILELVQERSNSYRSAIR